MDHGLWRRAEDVFHAALEQAPEARRTFVDEACRGHADLLALVDTLLSNDTEAGRFLDTPSPAAPIPARCHRRLGAYQVLSRLGAGGMGEVYRAHDARLGRDVAIKVLPSEFAQDPRRLARFRREARALAALNHPNIAAIYGLEEDGGSDYLVLELVQGEPLGGPLPVVAAVELACQLADALRAAHEQGIVHRDLKPANIKVTPQGTVKVLDFGLAKTGPAPDDEAQSGEPAYLSGDATATGQVLGTPGYMSPEQARGAAVDQRADVWGFGCLLYELLTGSRAFPGGRAIDAIGAVFDREPDWHALPVDTPTRLRSLLRHCLQKDAGRRLASIGEARDLLEGLRAGAGRRTPRSRSGSNPRIRALAVLPLTNLARDPEQDYFADGMTEAITGELARIRALRVISRTSTIHYRDTTKTAAQIGRELGADALVEGSVLRAGDRVRITAQLVHAATDRHVWAQSYDRDLRDVLTLQREVAEAVADEIQMTLTPLERAARLRRAPTVSLASQEAYLRGRYSWGRIQPQKSIEFYKQAIALDQNNALAYAGIGDSLCMIFGAVIQAIPASTAAPEAKAAALAAIALDETLAEPHVTLARVLFWYDRDAVGAERELRRAIEVNPNCAMGHFHLGLLLADLRRNREAIGALRRALQLDPVSCWNSALTGSYLYGMGEREEGLELVQRAMDLEPGAFVAWMMAALVHERQGDATAAAREARECLRLSAGLPIARGMSAYVFGQTGYTDEAETLLAGLLAPEPGRFVPPGAVAWAYLGLGDTEKTFEWLEAAYAQRDSGIPHLTRFFPFDRLSSDPRYESLLTRLGVPTVLR
jgi:eukaryotic-like serine/threonine-protein kinase